jgi:hypothetical protein
MWSLRPWLRVEQIELNVFGLVPRQAHERIVPPVPKARKTLSTLTAHPHVVPWRLMSTHGVQARLTAVTDCFNLSRRLSLLNRNVDVGSRLIPVGRDVQSE